MTTVIAKLTALILCLLPLQLFALANDSNQPIAVEADSLVLREQDNISIYEGNVKLLQGSLEITSERLVIHFNDNGDLLHLEMSGNPARFRQLDEQRQEMIGEAQQINYYEPKSLLELLQNAHFSHAGDVIESNRIQINTQDNNIQAGSPESDQRVKMVIQPRQDSAPAE